VRLASEGAGFASRELPTSTCWSTRSMRLETAMLAEHEAPRKVLELKSLRRRKIDKNYQLLPKVKPEAAPRFADLADAEGFYFGKCLERMLEVYEKTRKSEVR
jgi:hypothetical protein